MFVLLLGAAIAVVVVQSRRSLEPAPADATADAGDAEAGIEAAATADAGDADPETVSARPSNVPLLDRLPDGGAVPELPRGTPKSVRFGVILFRYRGAQGAKKDERPKERAREMAEKALEMAKEDFEEAAKRGDTPGSSANNGRMPRGILEPALEYALFTLDKGEIYGEPIDTPRGYWVLRRVK